MILYDKLVGNNETKEYQHLRTTRKCDIDSKTVRRLRANENTETQTLNKLCAYLQCGLDDIAQYVPDE